MAPFLPLINPTPVVFVVVFRCGSHEICDNMDKGVAKHNKLSQNYT